MTRDQALIRARGIFRDALHTRSSDRIEVRRTKNAKYGEFQIVECRLWPDLGTIREIVGSGNSWEGALE